MLQLTASIRLGKMRFRFDDWLKEIERVVKEEKGRSFTLSYWGDPDSSLHQYGSQNEKVRFLVKDLDEKIENLCSKLKTPLCLSPQITATPILKILFCPIILILRQCLYDQC